jgi:hypothetical protein
VQDAGRVSVARIDSHLHLLHPSTQRWNAGWPDSAAVERRSWLVPDRTGFVRLDLLGPVRALSVCQGDGAPSQRKGPPRPPGTS